jgi:hypothetical protein
MIFVTLLLVVSLASLITWTVMRHDSVLLVNGIGSMVMVAITVFGSRTYLAEPKGTIWEKPRTSGRVKIHPCAVRLGSAHTASLLCTSLGRGDNFGNAKCTRFYKLVSFLHWSKKEKVGTFITAKNNSDTLCPSQEAGEHNSSKSTLRLSMKQKLSIPTRSFPTLLVTANTALGLLQRMNSLEKGGIEV